MHVQYDGRLLNVERATPHPPDELIALFVADPGDPDSGTLLYLTAEEARRVASRLRRLADRLTTS